MTTEPVQDSPAKDTDRNEAFAWRVHPAVERPFAAASALVVIVALGLAVYVSFGNRLWSLFATVVMCLSLNRFFFANSFRIDADGVSAHTLFGKRGLGWDEVQRIVYGGHSAWISPYTRSSLRESKRGVLILFGRRREEVLEQLRRRVPADRIKAAARGR